MPDSQKIQTARIVTVGNEIVTGKITDSNSAFLARFLVRRGYSVADIVSVPDSAKAIRSAVRNALKKSEIVIVTGGLGPTHDDITKEVICRIFKCETKFDPKVRKELEMIFKKAGKKFPQASADYAWIPTAAKPVKNRLGIAPGLLFGKKLLLLPGVPSEMKDMINLSGDKLVPHGGTFFMEKVLHTGGIGETSLMEKMTSLKEALKTVDVAFLPHTGRVDIQVIASDKKKRETSDKLRKAVQLLKKDIKEYIWGNDDETIEEALGKLLSSKQKTLSTAESCTGGGIGSAVTSVSGSSRYFIGGAITYSDKAKEKALRVSPAVIRKYGAVSKEVALAMAKGARKKFKTDFAVSATGVAGPKGGTKDKPVGLVYIAIASSRWNLCRELRLGNNREMNRRRTVFEALYLLYKKLA